MNKEEIAKILGGVDGFKDEVLKHEAYQTLDKQEEELFAKIGELINELMLTVTTKTLFMIQIGHNKLAEAGKDDVG